VTDQLAGLVDNVVGDYLRQNPEVDRARMRDARLAADWHLVRELLHTVDSHLRAARAPHQLRREVATGVLTEAFGTPEGRAGAERFAQLMEQMAEADLRQLEMRPLPVELIGPSSAERTVHGRRWRYENREWQPVDTPPDGQ
jgi:hypothetical protein